MFKKIFFSVLTVSLILQSTILISAQQHILSNNEIIKISNFAIDINGKWNVSASAEGQQVPVVFEFKQTDNEFTGTISSDYGGGSISNGKITDDTITGVASVEIQGQAMQLKIDAKIEENKIKGTLSNDMVGTIPFSGEKAQ